MLGSGLQAAVDRAGTVTTPSGDSIGWWVGAEDRWHVPAAAPSLRQRLVNNAPVVATTIRVPGGDIEHRAYAATVAGRAAVVCEIENQTPTPVAVGFPTTAARTALRFSAEPRSEFVGPPLSLFVVPLAHRAVVRMAMALDGDPPDPAAAPDAAAVARGWNIVAATGARLVVPDPGLAAELETARAFLRLHAARLASEAKRADRGEAGAVADALTLLALDDEAGALRLATRLRPSRKGLPLVTPIQPQPCDRQRTKDSLTVTGLRCAAESVAGTVRDVYTRLVCENDDRIDVLGGFDLATGRHPVEVHGLPVADGTLSFALRWHGERPALLWETHTKAPVRLTARALDPTWSTFEAQGEALLAATSRS